MEVLNVKKLNKSYGNSRGIIDIDLSVQCKEVFGLIGPNGAGKSTLIRTILGLIHKDSGDISIFGLDSIKDKTKILEQIGYLPSEVFYYSGMKAIDLLLYSASFYKLDCRERINELATRLELDLNKKIEDMSLGNKKKVGIIQGLLHSPKMIILDEPTSGLDPLIQKEFFEIMEEENRRGATIIFSSHILSEVQKICNRVAIIKEGKIINVQKVSEIIEDSYKKVTCVLDESIDNINLEGITNLDIDDRKLSFLYKGDCNLLLKELVKYHFKNIDISDPTLEEIFMHYYEDR